MRTLPIRLALTFAVFACLAPSAPARRVVTIAAAAAPAAATAESASILRERIDVLLPQAMKDRKIDMWLIFTRENATDPILAVLGVEHIVARGAFIFALQDGALRKLAIAASYDVDPIRRTGIYDEVIAYGREGVKPHLAKAVEALDPRTIAVNYSRDVTIADGLTVGMRRYLEETLGARAQAFVSSEQLVVSLLGRKLPREIAALERAVEGTQQILAEALTPERVVPGRTTEAELGRWMNERAAQAGLGASVGSIVVGPPRGHSEPTDRVIERGDVIRIDWGASYMGYTADVQRTAYVLREGETAAPAWLEKLWAATLEANRAAIAALKPGATGNAVDVAARTSVVRAGYPEYPHGTGHAIGLKVHDVGPMLGPDWKERYGDAIFLEIEAGQVFAVEPLIYFKPDELDYEVHAALEEDVVVETTGARIIGTPQTEIILIR